MAEKSKVRGQSDIRRCECVSQYQDEKYGKGMRVHSIGGKSAESRTYRCSVCGVRK